MAQGQSVLALEVFRQENQLKMGIFEQEDIAMTVRHYSQCHVSFEEIDNLCQEVTSLLNKATKKGTLEPDLFGSLRKTGQLLWDGLLTRPVKDKLRAAENLSLVLSLDEELIYIPWELLYDGRDFLCLKFNLGRLVRTKKQDSLPQYRSLSNKLRMLILVNPTNDLKSAYAEGVHIRNQFDKYRNALGIDFKSSSVNTLYVKKNLRDYDIVHFAGHCEYDLQSHKNTGWVLSDGRFTAKDILAMGETLPLPSLVFSNACQSAEVEAHFVESDYQEKAYSLASAFLFAGTRIYIGSIRKIEDSESFIFAREFYAQLIKGKPIGECIRSGRLKLIHEHGLASVGWTAYLLYGDPAFALFTGKSKPQSLRAKGNAFLQKRHKKIIKILSAAIIFIFACLAAYIFLPTINPGTYIKFRETEKLFAKGRNQEVIARCGDIAFKDPLFLPVYPLIADAYLRLGNADEALRHYYKYALYSQKKADNRNLASAYIRIAWAYHQQGGYQKAFDFYNKAIALSRQNNDKLNEAIALRRLAVWHIDRGEYDKALELLTKSSEINREREHSGKFRYNLACDYFDLGLLFSNKEDFGTAREFYNKSLNLFQKLKLKSELSDCFFNLGEIYLFDKDYRKALEFYMKGLAIDKMHSNMPNIAAGYGMIGELHAEMGNFAEAEKFFNESVSVSKRINARPELASGYYNLGLLYKSRGDKDKAREYFIQARDIYRFIDTPDLQEVNREVENCN